jgi:putative redox protein
MHASLKWENGMHFICTNGAIKSPLDASVEHGGAGLGPTPKELLLNAMMGCTAIDVLAILKKMRQEVSSFEMEIDAEKTQAHPVHFKTALLIFKMRGPIDPDKALKAVDSSLTKYCGVNYMISRSCDIRYQLELNQQIVANNPVKFIEPAE